MSGCIAGILASCACSTASCCVGKACNCCGKMVPCGPHVTTRIIYAVLFFISTISCWIFAVFGDEILSEAPDWVPMNCFGAASNAERCFGALGVYRMTFAMFIFFGLQSLLMIGVSDLGDGRASFQNGFWLVKLILLVGMAAGAFFLPTVIYVGFGWLALVGATIFLFFQLVLLVDFAHSWTEAWVEKWDEDDENKGWYYALMGATFIQYIIAIALIIAMYVLFTKGSSSCGMNAIYITLVVIGGILVSAISIHPKVQEKNPRSGLLQSAVVTLYAAYLVWSAIMSEPQEWGCAAALNSTHGFFGSGSEQVSLIFGAAIVFVAVCYSAIRTSSKSDEILGGGTGLSAADTSHHEGSTLVSPASDAGDAGDDVERGAARRAPEAPTGPVRYNYAFFHFIFALASCYICMLMTNWDIVKNSGVTEETTLIVDRSEGALWVKIVSSWLVLILFAWSLVAPVIMPDRDWGYE